MEQAAEHGAALTVAAALAAGMVAQSLARHLRLPGIVLLLGTGVILGPDFLGVVHADALGDGLHMLVGFAVAVILFEGGMNLGLKRLRRQARVIQRLVTVGALVTAVGGSLAAHFLLHWDWSLAIPFGALVVVTGPTVITPLLRRIKVERAVETVLEAEGVLIDAIGAVLAVITLEVVISNPSGSTIAGGALDLITHIGFGLICGLVGGALIALLLRYRKVVPDGMENVFTLSLVLVLFQVTNTLSNESGIMAVTAAGVVVGNIETRVHRELLEFKEQLTVMLIGLLFVLLAADVRIDEIRALGLPGLLTLAALMFVVRPLNVLASTFGSGLNVRQKIFLCCLAPRGVVAAAIASLFAQTLDDEGIPGGAELRAMVFVVIAGTVIVQGLSGGLVARLLKLRRPTSRGYAIFGANELALAVGKQLAGQGQEVVFIDNNPSACTAASDAGFRVVFGNVLEERTLLRAQLEDRAACIGLSTNDEINLVFARTAADDFRVERIDIALRRDRMSVTRELLEEVGAGVLFGCPRDLDLWVVRTRRGLIQLGNWQLQRDLLREGDADAVQDPFRGWENFVLPLVIQRGKNCFPVSSRRPIRKGDTVCCALFSEQLETARERLEENGWIPVDEHGNPIPPES